MERILAPLAGWNVRGYSYGEVTPRGERHPGADLNVGGGDEDLGLPVVCFADGVVAERLEWDGWTHGYGNAGLVEHRLFGEALTPTLAPALTLALTPTLSQGEREEREEREGEGVRVWSLYAHLEAFDEGFVPGARLAAGQRIGSCGKSGG